MGMSIKDFTRCCRCCLAIVQALKPLFGSCLNEMLTKVTNLQVVLDDGYPHQICSSCILKLSTAHTFYLTVMKSQKTLEEILKANGEKQQSTETDDHGPEIKSHTWANGIETQDKEPCVQQVTSVRAGHIETEIPKKSTSSKPEIDSKTSLDIKEEYQCPQCEYTCEDQDQLEDHLQTHIGAKQSKHLPKRDGGSCVHLCSYCGKRFRWRTSLSKHVRRHLGRVHRCAHCPKKFLEASSLNVHLVSHSLDNPKPFHCEVCDRSFSQKSSLKKHAEQHATRRKLQCAQCEKSFLYKSTLKRHFESVHAPDECSLCYKLCSGKKFLDAHMRRHKKDEMDNLKSQTSTDNVMTESFNIQAVTVEFLCLICTKKFQSRTDLEVHVCSGDK